LCARGLSGAAIAEELVTQENTVSKWIRRWIGFEQKLFGIDVSDACDEPDKHWVNGWPKALLDCPRSGTPPKFTIEEFVSIIALACKEPSEYGREITN